MKKELKIIIFLLIAIILLAITGIVYFKGQKQEADEANIGGQQVFLMATTTAPDTYATDGWKVLKDMAGNLGSVIITGIGSGLTLYNATTTSADLRFGKATNSLEMLAQFPDNVAVGQYDFNVSFTDGLLAVWGNVAGGGSVTGTSTITYD